MYADDHQLFGVFGLEAFQVGDDVHAVDAAVGPKVQQDELAAQSAQAQAAAYVEPLQVGRKLGRPHRALVDRDRHCVAPLAFH